MYWTQRRAITGSEPTSLCPLFWGSGTPPSRGSLALGAVDDTVEHVGTCVAVQDILIDEPDPNPADTSTNDFGSSQ